MVIDTEKDEIIGRFPVAPAGVTPRWRLTSPTAGSSSAAGGTRPSSSWTATPEKSSAECPSPATSTTCPSTPSGAIYASCGDGAIAVIRQVDADRYEPLAT